MVQTGGPPFTSDLKLQQRSVARTGPELSESRDQNQDQNQNHICQTFSTPAYLIIIIITIIIIIIISRIIRSHSGPSHSGSGQSS